MRSIGQRVSPLLKLLPLRIWEEINMEAYKNDYTKQEDQALWILHEIRHKMSRRSLKPEAINRSAKELIRKHRLLNLELTRTVNL